MATTSPSTVTVGPWSYASTFSYDTTATTGTMEFVTTTSDALRYDDAYFLHNDGSSTPVKIRFEPKVKTSEKKSPRVIPNRSLKSYKLDVMFGYKEPEPEYSVYEISANDFEVQWNVSDFSGGTIGYYDASS